MFLILAIPWYDKAENFIKVYIREIDEELYLAVLQAATAIRGRAAHEQCD